MSNEGRGGPRSGAVGAILAECRSRPAQRSKRIRPRASESLPRLFRGAAFLLALPLLLPLAGCSPQPEPERQSRRFAHGPHDVEVVFHGEVTDAALLGAGNSLLDQVRPRDEAGKPVGARHTAHPGWLRFEYRIDGEHREVLIAKQPLLNRVSWEDIARAGAALGDGRDAQVGSAAVPQAASFTARDGSRYRVRLPICGQATHAHLSEWNLLIGAVHRGDMDFTGERYSWIRSPYQDEDLKVGYKGSLTWCRDEWRGDRVARGYFFVSRFHAAPPHLRTDRLHWRPLLERVVPAEETAAAAPRDASMQWSRSRRAGYGGRVTDAELFGPGRGFEQQVRIESGHRLDEAAPQWLRFAHEGKALLVAARPVRYGLSWSAIARAGAALGDDSEVRIGPKSYRQSATVTAANGERYRVRLLRCGRATLDLASEWNALLGGVHAGDGDFRPAPDGIYGWLDPPLSDADIGVGSAGDGTSTWCQETFERDGKTFAVNRGFLTISRYHATEIDFDGTGFGWRPVLEAIPPSNSSVR